MKASRILTTIAAAAAIVAMSACEWGAGDDATSWSDEYNWVNFSGTYRTSGTKTVTKTNTKGHTNENGEGTVTESVSTSEDLTGSAFTVYHSGQNLTITDGSGSSYTGKFKQMRSATGYENTQAVTARGAKDGVKTTEKHALAGDTIIGSFEATGPGGRMVGTFQMVISSTLVGQRTMSATLVGVKRTTQIEAVCTTATAVPSAGGGSEEGGGDDE